MDRGTVFTRTAKGAREADEVVATLVGELRGLLREIDGEISLIDLQRKLTHLSEPRLREGLEELAELGYIRECAPMAQTPPPAGDAVPDQFDLDFVKPALPAAAKDKGSERNALADEILRLATATRLREEAGAPAKARQAAAEQERRTAEEQVRRAAEEQRLREAEEQERRVAEEQRRREAEAQKRREAEERERREAEERERLAAEEQKRQEAEAQKRREAEEQRQREAEELERRVAEEQERLEAEARKRRDAEEQERQVAEERNRREAEEQRQREAEERERRVAEEQERLEAETRKRWEAEEQERQAAEERRSQEAEAQKRREAEEQRQREAEEQERREAEERKRAAKESAKREAAERAQQKAAERARKRAEKQARREEAAAQTARIDRPRVAWGKVVGRGLPLLAVVGFALIHVVSFDALIPQIEKDAAAQFGQPVKIESLHLALLPQPRWRLNGVSIGAAGQVSAPQVEAIAELETLFAARKVFKSVEFEAPVLSEEGLGWLLFGRPQVGGFRMLGVSAANARLESQNATLPAFDARADIGADGRWRKVRVDSVDKKLRLELQVRDDTLHIECQADTFAVPFAAAPVLTDFSAVATADRSGLTVSEFNGRIYGGVISGNALLKWGPAWSLEGDLDAKRIDAALLLPKRMEGGSFAGRASYALSAAEGSRLFAAPRLTGSFVVEKGALLGIDLARLLQSGGSGGKTVFATLAGDVVRDADRIQLRHVQLVAGALSAAGEADVAGDNVRGRFAVGLQSARQRLRADVAVSGTLDALRLNTSR